MKTIYIDSEYRCHATNPDGNLREVEDDFFHNKCATFIEGFCYDDSKGYEEIYPWKNYEELHTAQLQYELDDAENALAILLGGGSV